jgi:hypothetical protein
MTSGEGTSTATTDLANRGKPLCCGHPLTKIFETGVEAARSGYPAGEVLKLVQGLM